MNSVRDPRSKFKVHFEDVDTSQDFEAARAANDLRTIIEADLGPPGKGRRWVCPFHPGADGFNFAITPDRQHWKCHACQATGDVVDFVARRDGIELAEACRQLAGSVRRPSRPVKASVPVRTGKATGRRFGTLDAAIGAIASETGQFVRSWVYPDRDREIIFAVARFKPADGGKTYRPFHCGPDGGWVAGDPAGLLPLYNLPDLAEDAEFIFIVEGEKCADLASGLGLIATTSAHGAKSAAKSDWSPLAGRKVVIVPDHGTTGDAYATGVVAELDKLTPRPEIRIVNLPGLGDGEDIEEWLEAIPDSWEPDQARDALLRIARQAEPVKADPDNEDEFAGLSDEDLGIVPLASVKEKPIEWLWPYRLTRGGLAMMAGDGGIGKSQVLLSIAATVTTGGQWPDRSGTARLGDVVIVSAEDRPEDTIKPRLRALGADISRVTIVKAKYTIREQGKPPVVALASLQSLPYWREIFRRRPGCLLFIVDPLPSYLGRGVNDSKNTEIRNVLEPFLHDIIEPADICMLGNTHLNKSVDNKTPIHRIAGSIAYGALPRNVHFVVRDPENEGRRFFKQAKCNNAPDDLPALAFKIERREVITDDGEVIETAVPVFEAETVAVDLGEAVNGKPAASRGPEPKKTLAVAEWLHDFLKGRPGPTPLGAIFDAAGGAGLIGSKRTADNKWSSGALLYQSRERVPTLPEPRNGSRIDDLKTSVKPGGRDVIHWYLAGSEAAF